MITPTSSAQSTNAAASFTFTSTTSSGSVDSFAQQLLTAIEGYLNSSANGSQLDINIQGQQGQNSGNNSQFVVTLTNTGANPPATTSASTATTATAASTPAAVASTPAPAVATPAVVVATPADTEAASSTASTPESASSSPTAAELATMTPDQAYWASQPAAVQALQDMPYEQRITAAQGLADQGYSIDVPIMVWGWDPLTTMVQRQIDGYNWVPSLQQSDVSAGDTLNVPGSPAYDPGDPPPGSIPVSTAFAIGTNGQDNWIRNFNTTTGTVSS